MNQWEIIDCSKLLKSCSSVFVSVPVVDNLHGSVLLNPEFPQDDVVHAAHWVRPRVRFFMSVRKTQNTEGKAQQF